MSDTDRPHAPSAPDAPRSRAEPRLTTRHRDRRRLPRHVAVALPLAFAGLVSLLFSGNTLRPFETITTIEARMASKSDYFKDPEVRRLLLEHGIRVDIHRLGSRGIATQSLTGMDVVFPSGQPAAKLILNRQDRSVRSVRPFVSPLVLGTFWDYAETLVRAGVATRQPVAGGGRTLYYDLDMQKFTDLLDGRDGGRETGDQDKDGRPERVDTWNGIGFDRVGGNSNSGRVLVRTSSVCESNAAGTYLSILAFVKNGDSTPGAGEADKDKASREALDVAARIKPLIDVQGMWADEQADSYLSALGESIAPISLIYEHQYLAHQIDYERRHDRQDSGRVLLYPTPYALTEPQLISLSGKGDKLVRLIATDRELRRRAIELGFRVRFSGEDGTSEQLNAHLAENGIQVPTPNRDRTKVYEPGLDILEKIIDYVGDCRPPAGDTP
ncbi:hypothetical protein [Streptomyces sp. YU58]|uniref:hypothetical protein n=1 Tax=Streptomyces sp. SX92 TaxID=3158972 RepID=UPI0027B8FA8F|nr:hypothetical protein [Streptomyces coralus]WLW55491.1 hypothetical protein QU709_30965 [Streptomyces coralus]